MPTTELLTLILSIVAIVFAVVAIVFEVSFFVLQRNEARTLTRNVQDLVFQAVRNEKGIDQLSGQTMRLIEQLVRAKVSEAGAQAGPQVEHVVLQLQKSVADMQKELAERAQLAEDSASLRTEMVGKFQSLQSQIAEAARRAGERAAAPDTDSRDLELGGVRAHSVLQAVTFVNDCGGEVGIADLTRADISPHNPEMERRAWKDCERLRLLVFGEGDVKLTALGHRLAEATNSRVAKTVRSLKGNGVRVSVRTLDPQDGYSELTV